MECDARSREVLGRRDGSACVHCAKRLTPISTSLKTPARRRRRYKKLHHSATSRLSAKGHSVSIHCESQRKPLRSAIAEISSARYLCELSVQMVSSFKKDTLH